MKRSAAMHTGPAQPECIVCTTPSRCGSPALRTKKGPHCAGKANGADTCDCLNYCGDDPWLRDGRSMPCLSYAAREKQAAADSLWHGIVAFRLAWLS
jgi:hypothetical protein